MSPEAVKTRRVWIVAGEASGELFGARLATALRARCPDLELGGMGGDEMRAAGVRTTIDSTEMGVVGLVEVLRHLGMFRRAFATLAAAAEAARPDVVVLIDYPGFNLRFLRRMHAAGIPCVYYVSPQVWAWHRRRIPEMARLLRRILVIFPFEEAIWAEAGLDVRFVGHPLLEILPPAPPPETRDPNLVLLLPGSRQSEVSRLLTPMLDTAAALHARHPTLRFVLPTPRPRVQAAVEAGLQAWAKGAPPLPLEVTRGDTVARMAAATAGLAASGTVTVQAAIMGLPLVVAYRLSPPTYWLASLLVKVPHFTMVNLVAGDTVFEEFLQGRVRAATLAPALERILPGGERRAEVLAGMTTAVARLGAGRDASRAAADAILELLD